MAQHDPSNAGASAAVLEWLQGTLLGTLATSIAVIAIASVGFLMLAGRTDLRRGSQVVLGCFLIFGASTLAGGLLATVLGNRVAPDLAQSHALPPLPQLPPPTAYQPASSSPFDPYAGAAIPQQ